MRLSRLSPIALALTFALAGTACGEQARSTAQQIADETRKGVAEATAAGGDVDKALAEASRKLQEENLSLQMEEGGPKAELTPQGDLLINGTAVPFTPEQREAALAYRKEVLAVAEAGMAIGRQGAAIGGEAAALAIESIFGGNAEGAEGAEARIEAEAKKIEAAALALCDQVEGLEVAQERLTALVPEFAPYAKSINVDTDCNSASDDTAAEPAAPAEGEAEATVNP
jgi:hypothetical protein